MIRDYAIPILFAIVVLTSVLTFAYAVTSGVEQHEIDFENKTNGICNNVGLEVLSTSSQLFGDDYVVCYNPRTNETREILI